MTLQSLECLDEIFLQLEMLLNVFGLSDNYDVGLTYGADTQY